MALVKSSVLIKKYIESLLFYFENPALVNEELMVLKFKEIILLLLNTEDTTVIIEIMHNLFSPKEFSFKDIIESHILSPLSSSNLAQLTNRSLASFKREFKKIYDDSPANYIKNKRLEKAAELLVISSIPISAIAYDCLFNDIAHFSSSFKLKQLMYLLAVCIPVELALFWLFTAKYVPEIITFDGRNFDIIAGITAPLIALIAFRKNKTKKKLVWIWHIMSIILLRNIVIHALLSTPTAFQQIAFEQPNVAIYKFPFLLLPAIIVPVVLISNIAGFVILNRQRSETSKK